MMVREARCDDAQAIAAIYAHHVLHGTASFDTVPPDVNSWRTKLAEIGAKGWPFLVVERDERVIGYAYAAQFRDRPAYAETCENSVYISAHDMGCGIGTALLTALVERSTLVGFRQMIAVIGGGEPASIALHEKLDFVHAGRMRAVGRKFGRLLDTVYMQKALE